MILIVSEFGHTHYAPDRLYEKYLALRFPKNNQYLCAGTIPTKRDGLFENQNLNFICGLLDIYQIRRFIFREPDRHSFIFFGYAVLCLEYFFHIKQDILI